MEAPIQVRVSPSVHACVWFGVVFFYAICGTFLAFQATLYFYIPTKVLPLISNMELLSIGVRQKYFGAIGSVFALISAVHYYGLFDMLLRTLCSKRLIFAAKSASAEASPIGRAVHRSLQSLSIVLEPILPSASSHTRRIMRQVVGKVYGVWKAFGVMSPHYGVVYVTRELVQTAIQTYQAYRLSALVARQWMNWIIVLLLVFNCWATPIIQSRYHSSYGLARLLCLLVNLSLDSSSYVAFPTALFLPYYLSFDQTKGNFDMRLWYTDVWLIQVINEWQLLVVTSFWDAAGKFFIAYNITRTLRSIPRLISCPTLSSTVGKDQLVPKMPSTSHVLSAVAPSGPTDGIISKSASSTGATSVWERRVERLGHRVLGVWGLAVLACHIRSAMAGNNEQCLVQVRPWLTYRPVCSLMEISCFDSRLSGNATDFDSSINSIQKEWLAYLIIRHCDQVEITPQIQTLPFLLAFKLFNSTLVRWEADAAFTQATNPNIVFVFMAKIKATAIPPGIYDRDFPLKLGDVEFSDWNVTELPLELADVWPPRMFLVIEKFQFSTFPEVLKVLRPGFLSISFNNFTELPLEFWANDQLVFLNVNGNPVREFPLSRQPSLPIIYLTIVPTSISQLPSWIQPEQMVELDAADSPYCQNLFNGDAIALNVTQPQIEILRKHVNCTRGKLLTHYPLEDEPIINPSKVQ